MTHKGWYAVKHQPANIYYVFTYQRNKLLHSLNNFNDIAGTFLKRKDAFFTNFVIYKLNTFLNRK